MIQALAALLGGLSVAAGAFGAHAIADPQARQWLATASQYALPHAVAVLWAAERHPLAALLWLVGATLFATSLTVLALGAPRMLAAGAPVGGALMIGGWAVLLAGFLSRP